MKEKMENRIKMGIYHLLYELDPRLMHVVIYNWHSKCGPISLAPEVSKGSRQDPRVMWNALSFRDEIVPQGYSGANVHDGNHCVENRDEYIYPSDHVPDQTLYSFEVQEVLA